MLSSPGCLLYESRQQVINPVKPVNVNSNAGLLQCAVNCYAVTFTKACDMGAVRFVEIDADRVDQRLDNFLTGWLSSVPKSWVYRVIRKGEVRINGKRAKPSSRLAVGDVVRIPPVTEAAVPVKTGLPSQVLLNTLASAILYEDDCLVALNKPSGLAVHGGSGQQLGLIEALRVLKPECKTLQLVHRLDRDTSGVILVAKKRRCLVAMQDAFRQRGPVSKVYGCLVAGQWPATQRQVNQPLYRHEADGNGERRVSIDERGKAALTRFRLIQQFERCAWLEARPQTGRTHQIRVHCQYLGHPILGDDKYQNQRASDLAKELGLKRLFLHALQLTLPHPQTGEQVTFAAHLPARLQALLKSLEG